MTAAWAAATWRRERMCEAACAVGMARPWKDGSHLRRSPSSDLDAEDKQKEPTQPSWVTARPNWCCRVR